MCFDCRDIAFIAAVATTDFGIYGNESLCIVIKATLVCTSVFLFRHIRVRLISQSADWRCSNLDIYETCHIA